ncbi:hypothetical protein Hanom_Chr12g01084311 [Helianthus anomalus]
MYVCIGVCEEVRAGLGGCERTKRTSLGRRWSKRVARLGRWQGNGPGNEPHTVPSQDFAYIIQFNKCWKNR